MTEKYIVQFVLRTLNGDDCVDEIMDEAELFEGFGKHELLEVVLVTSSNAKRIILSAQVEKWRSPEGA